ncbi:Oidioi.mRNA.OKI2018_I69.chr2.g5277.t1.cds [Oikopleura dioica]|uniref:Oidioi.mRNA.OKI2018_I69.chr2.g5277.t1.cds n=1 Tax=Oikopleura dioica TaxID=34765 RepID=A0ABN7SZU5_OIKDI|nr:Oidioi.mRNA.OKI2018_I69.chr2.g5277.t1.cds [Oikopleura dioica]
MRAKIFITEINFCIETKDQNKNQKSEFRDYFFINSGFEKLDFRALKHVERAKRRLPRDLDHDKADKARARIEDILLQIYKAQGNNTEVVKILDKQRKRQSDFDEVVKLWLERAEFVDDKIGDLQEALEYAQKYSLRVPTADCFFAFAKHHVTVEKDFQKGLKYGYDASQIYEEVLGERSKKTISVKVALAKAHLLNDEKSTALSMLLKSQKNIEFAFGIVSDEAAENFELVGSIHLHNGHPDKALKSFNQAIEIFSVLNPKHSRLPRLRELVKSLRNHPDFQADDPQNTTKNRQSFKNY